MAATVTASIASLILTVDDPLRDDLTVVKVWASTTNGFTPSAGNLVYTGNALTILLANLTPLTTYYIRYAYISEIDPDEYDYAAQLSGTPNKIDGSIIVDGSISADQISAIALRGKMLAGNAVMDEGTLTTASINYMSVSTGWDNVTPTVTVSVLDTVDFPTAGSAAIITINPSSDDFSGTQISPYYISYVRYTGKTSTSLTGVSGFHSYGIPQERVIPSGSIVVPFTACSPVLKQYVVEADPWGSAASSNWFGLFTDGYIWRSAGGNAIAVDIESTLVADTFTYTLGSSASPSFYPGFSGVSGLAAWSNIRKVIYDNPGFPTTTRASTGATTTLTTNTSNNVYLKTDGGTILLASTTIGGYVKARYLSYSGTTITLEQSITLTAATYTIIPLFSRTILNAALNLISISNANNLYFSSLYISNSKSKLNYLEVNNSQGTSSSNAVDIYQTKSGSALQIYAPLDQDRLSINIPSIDESIASGVVSDFGILNSVGNLYLAFHDGTNFCASQKAGATQLFCDPWAVNIDSITFDDTANTYSFNADDGTANANIAALRAALGTATVSSSATINIIDSFTANATRYGILNTFNITNATLTADRTLRAAYNVASATYQNSVAFSPNVYGAWNVAETTATSGNTLNGEGQLYGSYNAANHGSDDATYTRVESAYGSWNYAQSLGNTSLVDNAYAVYARVRTAGTAASPSVAITTGYALYSIVDASAANRNITTAYNLYLTSTETGTITTKWGIYQNNDWPHRLLGNVNFLGAINVVPTVSVPATGATITLTTDSSVLCLNHTATIATLTINFPSSPSDGHCISICSRSIVTTLTLGNGTFRGAITTIAAGGFAEYIYSTTGAAWFRKG